MRSSAIAEHALYTGHAIDLDNATIIRKGFRRFEERKVLEAVEIIKASNLVNRSNGLELSSIWREAIRRQAR